MGIFWNAEERRLKCSWRMLLHLGGAAAIITPPVVATVQLMSRARKRGLLLAGYDELVFDKVVNLVVGPMFTLLVVLSVYLAARYLDRRQLGDLGLRISARWWRDLVFGFLLGGLLMGIVFLAERALGWITVTGTVAATGVPFVYGLGYSAVKFLCVGVYEEVVMRGYQLKNLAEGLNGTLGMNPKTALLASAGLTSLVFSLLHLRNENSGAFSTIGLVFFGILFAAAVLLTRQLAIPIGLHIGWNFFQRSVFGFPPRESATLIAIETGGPDLFVGGAFGPEAGLIGMATAVIGVALIAGWVRLSKGSVRLRTELAVPALRETPGRIP